MSGIGQVSLLFAWRELRESASVKGKRLRGQWPHGGRRHCPVEGSRSCVCRGDVDGDSVLRGELVLLRDIAKSVRRITKSAARPGRSERGEVGGEVSLPVATV